MRRVLAPFSSLAFVCALALAAAAQVNPPVPPPPSGPVNPPGSIVTPAPGGPNAPVGGPDGNAGRPARRHPAAGRVRLARAARLADPAADHRRTAAAQRRARQDGRRRASTARWAPSPRPSPTPRSRRSSSTKPSACIYVSGVKVGTTTVTVTDSRAVTRDVPVRVAYAAGTVAEETSVRVTGNPSSAEYLRDTVADAVERAATLRPGVSIDVPPETVPIHGDLRLDNRTEVDVPVHIAGNGYLPVNGTTHVTIENTALPPIYPARLLVSDYPERLTANGVLFTARLDRTQGQRFLYYHYNPGTEPARRILLKAHNASNAPAIVQMIDGTAGPGTNEMEVGHLSTKRFLVREARNEGQVMTIAAGATLNLVDHPLPPQNVVSAILQLRLVSGDPLDLALVAQDAHAPLDQSIDTTLLLAGGAPHARGVYPVPTFFFDRTYDVDGADLDIAIGQLPLPNMRQGEALSGDYGVEQSMSVVIVNMTAGPRSIALYANPRGGRATGTFLIDGTLVQAHALAAFSRFKIWQERINAGTFRRIEDRDDARRWVVVSAAAHVCAG